MDSNKLIICYSGSLSAFNPDVPHRNKMFYFKNYSINNPDTRSGFFLFKGLKTLLQKYPEYRNRIEFHAWGLIDNKNRIQVNEMGLEDIVFIEGYLSKEKSLRKMEMADVFYLPLERGVNGYESYALPGKLYEYLRALKPVLTLSTNSECVRILEKSNLGIFCDPFNDNQIAEELKSLIENKARLKELYKPNEEFIIDNFNSTELTRQLANEFTKLIG